MKIILKILILLIVACNISFAQSLYWQRIYGLNQLKDGVSGIETFDGGFIISGHWDPGSGSNGMILIKTDMYGQTQWEKDFDVTDPIKIIQLSDSNFLSVGGGANGAGIFKIKNNGDSIWYREYGNNGDAKFLSVKEQTGNNGYIICGKKPTSTVNEGGYIIKVDTSSNLIWENTFTDIKFNVIYANDLIIESEGNSIITGWAYNRVLKAGDPFICKINNSGNLFFSKIINTSIQNDGGERIIKSYDNNYIVSGFGTDFTSLECAQFLKIDTLGKVLISRSFEGCTNLITKTLDNNYMLGGYIQSGEMGRIVRFGLRKIDQEGNSIWQKTLDNCYSKTYPNDFESTTLGGYFIVGYYRDTTIQFDTRSIYVAKTDAEGNANYPVRISENIKDLNSNSYSLNQNYPNPFNPKTNITFSIPVSGNVTLKVFDLLGKEVITLFKGFRESGDHTVDFDGINLSSGIYFYKLEAGDFTSVKRMVLIK